jgi:hypothetical protein
VVAADPFGGLASVLGLPRAEDSLERDSFELEQLWWHMGLPM